MDISILITSIREQLGKCPEEPSEVSEDDLAPWRERIDQIDLILLALLNERSTAANTIGLLKKELDVPVYAPRREEQVLAQVREANEGPLPDAAVRHLFERIIDETRSLERQHSENESDRDISRT